MKTKKAELEFFTWAHNVHGALTNGSFVMRVHSGKLVQFMNGDNMGAIDAVPDKMVSVPYALAYDLLPGCCKPPRKRA